MLTIILIFTIIILLFFILHKRFHLFGGRISTMDFNRFSTTYDLSTIRDSEPIVIEQEVFNRLSTISDMSTLHLELGDKPYLHVLMLDVIQKHLFHPSSYESYHVNNKPNNMNDIIKNLKLFLFPDNSTESQELRTKYNTKINEHSNWILNSFPIDLIHKVIKDIQDTTDNSTKIMNKFHSLLIFVDSFSEISILLSKYLPTISFHLPNIEFINHHGAFNCVIQSEIQNHSDYDVSTLPTSTDQMIQNFNKKITELLTHKDLMIRINKGSLESPKPPSSDKTVYRNITGQMLVSANSIGCTIMHLSIVYRLFPYIYFASHLLPRQMQILNINRLTPNWFALERITSLEDIIYHYIGESQEEKLKLLMVAIPQTIRILYFIHLYGYVVFDHKFSNYGVTNDNQIVLTDFDIIPAFKNMLDMKLNAPTIINGISLTYMLDDSVSKKFCNLAVFDFLFLVLMIANIHDILFNIITREHTVFFYDSTAKAYGSETRDQSERVIHTDVNSSFIGNFLLNFINKAKPDMTLRQLYVVIINLIKDNVRQFITTPGIPDIMAQLDVLINEISNTTRKPHTGTIIKKAATEHVDRLKNLGITMASTEKYKGNPVNINKNLTPLKIMKI